MQSWEGFFLRRAHEAPVILGDVSRGGLQILGRCFRFQRHLAAGFREGRVDPEGATSGTPAEPGCQVFLLAQRSPTLTQAECGFQGTQKHAGIERGALYQRRYVHWGAQPAVEIQKGNGFTLGVEGST